MVKAFPSDLVTPVDAAYMKKIVRRARQNKKKRKENVEDDETAASATPTTIAKAKATAAVAAAKPDVKSMPKAPKHKLMKAVKPAKAMEPAKAVKPVKVAKPAASKTWEIVLPSKGQVFPQRELRHDEFEHMTKD